MATVTIGRPVTITNNGSFLVASNPLTWSGAIGGTGTLVKSGPGELNLTGVNTYSGGTTVTGGILSFTNDDSLGAAGTGITLNGGVISTTNSTNVGSTFSRNITLAGNGGINVALNPIIWSGNIGGAGTLVKSGSGALTLSAANTYTDGTTVTQGTLSFAHTNGANIVDALGSGAVTLNGGTLRNAAGAESHAQQQYRSWRWRRHHPRRRERPYPERDDHRLRFAGPPRKSIHLVEWARRPIPARPRSNPV